MYKNVKRNIKATVVPQHAIVTIWLLPYVQSTYHDSILDTLLKISRVKFIYVD